ncbi:NUDIX domain-containing protein [Streptomyces sp. NPDC046977]|uniref:NUDIX domain-containing protein n=1 Tax=Streptomyces sp. NPDC046977 TaxID=3154703 RepID=UPI0034111A2A
MKRIIAGLWRTIRGPLQWRVMWLANSKYMVGVTGVVRDSEGRVLLLRHRLWPEDRPWGLPGGYAKAGEDFRDTVAREVREETGLEVRVGELVHLKSGFRLRVEVAYAATLVGGSLKIDAFEVLEAKWASPDDLPQGLQETHRLLIQGRPDD